MGSGQAPCDRIAIGTLRAEQAAVVLDATDGDLEQAITMLLSMPAPEPAPEAPADRESGDSEGRAMTTSWSTASWTYKDIASMAAPLSKNNLEFHLGDLDDAGLKLRGSGGSDDEGSDCDRKMAAKKQVNYPKPSLRRAVTWSPDIDHTHAKHAAASKSYEELAAITGVMSLDNLPCDIGDLDDDDDDDDDCSCASDESGSPREKGRSLEEALKVGRNFSYDSCYSQQSTAMASEFSLDDEEEDDRAQELLSVVAAMQREVQ